MTNILIRDGFSKIKGKGCKITARRAFKKRNSFPAVYEASLLCFVEGCLGSAAPGHFLSP